MMKTDSLKAKRWRRRVICALIGVVLALIILHQFGARPFLPPLPAAPDIASPSGPLPDRQVAFEVWTAVDTTTVRVGSGFFLRLPDGAVIGVTAGHTTMHNGGQFRPVFYKHPRSEELVASFARPAAPVGNWQHGGTVDDYLLLQPDTPPAAAMVLAADPRGAPQPGERLVVFSGVSKPSNANRERFAGTVENSEDGEVKVRMDDLSNPGMMSGSPVLSAHTGKVVGILISGYWQPGVISIYINPIATVLAAVLQ